MSEFWEADIEDASWYEEVVSNRGKYILRLNVSDEGLQAALPAMSVVMLTLN